MRGLGDNSGWITERGEVEWTNHTGDEDTEIHHVDIALMAFGDELGYPGREHSHYNDSRHPRAADGFWEKYGLPANEMAMSRGWIQWGNNPDMHPSLFVALFKTQPSPAAIKTLESLVEKSECEIYSIGVIGNSKGGVDRANKDRALEYVYDMSHGIAEEIQEMRWRAGLCG